MKADNLKKVVSTKVRRGRGIGSGKGKTSGRGSKGQKSRAGFNIPIGFEGGQTPLKRRLPKFGGFNRSWAKNRAIVSLDEINANYKASETVSPQSLFKKGLIKSPKMQVKILGDGKIKKKVKVKDCLYSKTAGKALGISKKK